MSWINTEKLEAEEMLERWATENHTVEKEAVYLSKITKENKSYWENYDNTTNICEYDFSSIPQFKALLEENLKDELYEGFCFELAVQSFKEKVKVQNEEAAQEDAGENSDSDKLTIPEFVYAF